MTLQQGNKHLGFVERPNIEAAAREGYLDRIHGQGFSPHYDAAPPPWQRNYEIGRLWATGMFCCGIEPPDWPEGMNRQPHEINVALTKINAQIGALRPEVPDWMGRMVAHVEPEDPALRFRLDPVIRRRGGRWMVA
jgi:hypothetical protein